jgi:hypothetical protein
MPATRQAARSIRHTRATRSRITAQSRTAAGRGEVRFRKNGPVHPQVQPAVSRSGVTSGSSLQLLRRVRIPLVQVGLLTLCNLLLKRVQRLISDAASGAQHFSGTALRHRPAEPAFGTHASFWILVWVLYQRSSSALRRGAAVLADLASEPATGGANPRPHPSKLQGLGLSIGLGQIFHSTTIERPPFPITH